MTTSRRYTIEAVDRALLMLEALAEHPEIGVTELAKQLGFTKTLTFRLLQTLEERGFVAKSDGQAQYALGYRLAYLGSCVDQWQSVVVAAAPIMDRLRDQTDENINLIARDGTRILFLATRESRQSMRLFAQAGRRGPLHAGGGSKLLLAYAPDEIVEVPAGRRREFAEDFGVRQERRTRLPREPGGAPLVELASHTVEPFEHRDVVTGHGDADRCRQPTDATADDDDVSHPPPPGHATTDTRRAP